MKITSNQEMKNFSNMRIGGIAKNFILLESKQELEEVYKKFDNIFLIGNGTNLLLNDDYLNWNFVSTKNLTNIKEIEEGLVEVEAGANLSDLMEFLSKNDYTGIENLAGIPGSIGGLVYMNGGAFGTEIFDVIESVEILDENKVIRNIKKENLDIKYRTTEIKEKKWTILSVIFRFNKGFDSERVKEIHASRKTKHPLDKPSLGSTFKNPKGDFAARLISESGLSGKVIGGIQISEKHPNFLLNLGNAKFEDVINTLFLIKKEVKNKFDILLEEEIIIVY